MVHQSHNSWRRSGDIATLHHEDRQPSKDSRCAHRGHTYTVTVILFNLSVNNYSIERSMGHPRYGRAYAICILSRSHPSDLWIGLLGRETIPRGV